MPAEECAWGGCHGFVGLRWRFHVGRAFSWRASTSGTITSTRERIVSKNAARGSV